MNKQEHRKGQKLGPSLKTLSVSNGKNSYSWGRGEIGHMGRVTTVTH